MHFSIWKMPTPGTLELGAQLSRQRPFQGWVVQKGNFVGFAELQGTFDRAADVMGSGGHSQVVGDGI